MMVEILKYFLPCISIVAIAYWFIHRPIKLEKIRLEANTQRENMKTVTPIKLAAYERLVLFLERTSPDEMLNREMEPNMSNFEFQMKLLKVVRSEFEHNVAQQIYVSNEAWEAIIKAKDNISQLINICSTQVKSNDPAIQLAKTILKTYNEANETATEDAIMILKAEIARLIN